MELIKRARGRESNQHARGLSSAGNSPHYGNADLGIVPKRKDNFGNEAFSTKILEFMAMSVPVIVSDTMVDKFTLMIHS